MTSKTDGERWAAMTAHGKPDRCPRCGSYERSKCNLLPTPAGYEDLCCDDWHSSPVPAARKGSAEMDDGTHIEFAKNIVKAKPVPAAAPNFRTITDPESGQRIPIKNNAIEAAPQAAMLDDFSPEDRNKASDAMDAAQSAPQAESVPVTRQTIDRGQNDEHGGIKTESHPEGDAASNEAASVQSVRTQGVGEDRQTGQLDASTDMPILQTRGIAVAESVPSGKDAADEFLLKAIQNNCERFNGAQGILAARPVKLIKELMRDFALSQTAALAAERDQWIETCKYWNESWKKAIEWRDLNAAHIEGLERSNSLLRERITQLENKENQ